MWVDSHCHLNYPQLQKDFGSILHRAKEQNVDFMLAISTKVTEFNQVLPIAEANEHIFCTVGVHPHYAKAEMSHLTKEKLIDYTEHKKVVGLGETGLDYYYENSPKEAQMHSLNIHIDVARETGLPLVIHTRDADKDTIDILETEYKKGPFTGVIHCFSAGCELAEKMLAIGFYISVSGIITFKKSEMLRDIVKDIPLNRLLVETDSPYLAPQPFRGKPNEPSYVKWVGEKLAEIKDQSVMAVQEQTTENFFPLFSKCKL